MLAQERHQAIVTLLRERGAVTTAELMERFRVSVETVRRDLLILEREHRLQRVHPLVACRNSPFNCCSVPRCIAVWYSTDSI